MIVSGFYDCVYALLKYRPHQKNLWHRPSALKNVLVIVMHLNTYGLELGQVTSIVLPTNIDRNKKSLDSTGLFWASTFTCAHTLTDHSGDKAL